MDFPFRHQVSDYDCVPTTILNSLSLLFRTKEIPPIVIQKIYLYCLDTTTNKTNLGHGTTDVAVQLLANWMSNFKKNEFSVTAEFITGKSVNFSQKSKVTEYAKSKNGAAIVRIKTGKNEWHYILTLQIENGHVLFFDPYPKKKLNKLQGKAEFLHEMQSKTRSPNLKISQSHVSSTTLEENYVLGPYEEREALLIRRKSA